MRKRSGFGAALLVCVPVAAQAQNKPIPVVSLAVSAESRETFTTRPSVRGIAGGRVLVGDARGGRIIVFDSTLSTFTVSADSSGSNGVFLRTGTGRLISYVGDSTVIVDGDNRSFVVIDPSGNLGRAMAHAKSADMSSLNSAYAANPGFDREGGFIYRAQPKSAPLKDSSDKSTRDTVAIVRADFNTRKVDTIGSYTKPKVGGPVIKTVVIGPGQHRSGTKLVTPILESPDDWAVMLDGTLAILRQHDYHIDWVAPDGTKSSTPKLPFDWRRLTDLDKQARIDSMKRVIDSLDRTDTPFSTLISRLTASDGLPIRSRATGAWKMDTIVLKVSFVPLSQIPDYVPPIGAGGGVKADMDNNLWILPTTSSEAGSGLVYDVVNRSGELFQRVRVPKDCVLVGFGRSGVVILAKNNATRKTWTLVRGRVPVDSRTQ